MPSQMMESLVESSRRGVSRRSVSMKLLSAGIQLVAIAALVIIPLYATDAMPEPPSVMPTFMVPPPPPPPPPPAPAAPARRAEAVTPSKPVAIPKPIPATDFIAPVEIPDDVVMEAAMDAGFVVGGMETEGVPGGAVDGVVGGMPGAPMSEPVRVGGEVRPPEKIKDVRPEYPSTARAARIEGAVILEAVIDSRGVVTEVKVLKSIPLLDQAAVEAVKQWRYEATRLNGEAVPVIMTVTLNFALA